MNRLYRLSYTAMASASPVVFLWIVLFSMLFVSCRSSKQVSKGNSTRTNSTVGPAQTALKHEVDSLLIVEEKLLEVIDSMTGLVNADHSRIHDLERQVHEMQFHAVGTPLPPAALPYDSRAGSDPPPAPSAPNPVTAPSSTAPSSATSPSSAHERYGAALRMFNDNNFESALTEFQSLERDDPNGTYISNYKYWEGECYYGEKRYNMALQTFGTMLSQYPNSAKAPAAQFKIGECYEKLNIPSSAREAYKRVIADYPSSEYKARAQSNLNALK
jgi:tol-pal system protein YbgF